MFIKYSLNRLIVAVVAGGFLFLLADMILEHWDILKTEAMSWVPIVFSTFGLIVSTYAFVQWKEKAIRLLQVTLLVSFIVAGVGLYFHIAKDDDDKVTTEQTAVTEKEKDKPILAPLAFAGIAIIGLLGTMRKWQSEVVQK